MSFRRLAWMAFLLPSLGTVGFAQELSVPEDVVTTGTFRSAAQIYTSLRDGEAVMIRLGEEQLVVMHYLGGAVDEAAREYGRELAEEAVLLAGTEHFLVVPEESEAARELAESVGAGNLQVVTPRRLQTRSALAEGLPESPPITEVLGEQEEPLYVYRGKGRADFLPVRSLSTQLERLTRHPALDAFYLDRGVAMEGYDPVAMVEDREAERGRRRYESRWRGMRFLFASEENRSKFAANPRAYVPRYGGWDAMAMVHGEQIAPSPGNFHVSEQGLLLFYEGVWGNAKDDWLADESENREAADRHWKEIVGGAGP